MKIPIVLFVVCYLAVQYQQGYAAEIREEIFRGSPAKRGQFPYQALLLSSNKTGPQNAYYLCGGSLISTKYILTAAHCTYGYYMTDVFLGVISTLDLIPEGSFHDQIMVDDNVVLHPDYHRSPTLNDIAVIKLNTEPELSNYIAIIPLPNYSWRKVDYYKDDHVLIAGFGQKYEGDTSPATMDFTKQLVMGQSDCKSIYQNLTDGMICTEKKKIYAGPCKGDSGGPLTLRVRNRQTVIGLVSFGLLAGCNETYPESYTNVAYYLPFIKKATGISYNN